MGSLLDRFDGHDGPVRGVHFHNSQPIFVSGGDDYKIKVWNHKQKRCLFTLLGHLDYIRTVQFHHEHPWIVSASDDQTIRIWNWQSRSCIAVLTGHNHYVMAAHFHSKDDLVVSASLDQTVRVWDTSSLNKKSASMSDLTGIGGSVGASQPGVSGPSSVTSDFFGVGDVVVKYVLEGHDRGVNWAEFHPNLPLIVSGADDRLVKIWRMNETKAWEVDTLRGHTNNVSCAMFQSKQDIIVSNSEDKSIRVWDMSKRIGVQTFRREHDRFWILSAHPEMNILAAGHDSGMIVFKLERERPAFASSGTKLYYVKERFLRVFDFATSLDNSIVSIRRGSFGLDMAPRSVSINQLEPYFLLNSNADGGTYELHKISGDGSEGDVMRGLGISACFVARNRFAVLDQNSNSIIIKNLQNDLTKKIEAPCSPTHSIFYAGTGSLLCRGDDKVVMFDIQQKLATGEVSIPSVRYVSWSDDGSLIAFLSKHVITIANKKMEQKCTIHETIRVKSGAWDIFTNQIFVYTTMNHMKYCLVNGDTGIIQTLEAPVYITRVQGNQVFCLDREGRTRVIKIDTAEFMFKLALMLKQYSNVVNHIRSGSLTGQSIIAYLEKKGFPQVALHFVQDNMTRFNLALEGGKIDVAVEAARQIDRNECWIKLGEEALLHGHLDVVEFCYQKLKCFDKLSFLYLISGNNDKLRKMSKIAAMRSDSLGLFNNSLFLGDVRDRIKAMEESGQYSLAFLSARCHGLETEANRLKDKLPETFVDISSSEDSSLLTGQTPILRDGNWPLVDQSTAGKGDEPEWLSLFGDSDVTLADSPAKDAHTEMSVISGLNDYSLSSDIALDNDDDGGWEVDEIALPDGESQMMSGVDAFSADSIFIVPSAGPKEETNWVQQSSNAGVYAAACDFEGCARILSRQIAAMSMDAISTQASNAALGCKIFVQTISNHRSPFEVPIGDPRDETTTSPFCPKVPGDLNVLEARVKQGFNHVSTGKFSDAIEMFRSVIRDLVFCVAKSRSDSGKLHDLLQICKDYLLALSIEICRKEISKDNASRSAELAAYFTHCNLQPTHLALALRSAMTISFNIHCYGAAGSFARRLLELNPGPKISQTAKQVLSACEQKAYKDEVEIEYDAKNAFVTCAASYRPIYRGSVPVLCPYCRTSFEKSFSGGVCTICSIGRIGADSAGLPWQSR